MAVFKILVGFANLFFNLHTCTAGSQVTGTLGVSPPTVHEYSYSCNCHLLVDPPADDLVEEEFNVWNDYCID